MTYCCGYFVLREAESLRPIHRVAEKGCSRKPRAACSVVLCLIIFIFLLSGIDGP